MTRPDPPRLEVTVLDRLISVAMWIIALCWMVPLMATMMVVALVVPSDRTQWLTRLYCGGQVRLTGARWRAVVDPAIDTETPYIFCCNHVNLLDHVTMYNSTPHFKQGVELASHFDIPVYGWFMKQRGTIPVHRGQGAVDRLRVDVRREIDAGHSVLVFPEGTRTVSGRVGSFRKGLFRIARDLDVQVVPVAVTGMYEIMRKGSALMRPGREVTVWVDAPLRVGGLDDEALERAVATVRDQVAKRVDDHWDGVGDA